jgi:hypothetical protein
MNYRVDWARDDGGQGSELLASEDEAKKAAREVAGTALVLPESGGSPTVFRNGWELEGAEASDAFLKFGHEIEVGVSRSEVPETNIDPADLTGSGFRAGSRAVYGWRVRKPGEAPGPWIGTFWSPEAALTDAEKARSEQAELTRLPIVRIDR